MKKKNQIIFIYIIPVALISILLAIFTAQTLELLIFVIVKTIENCIELNNLSFNLINYFFTSDLESTETDYDYIIVGAGTAGSILAAGLDSNLKILVLEAGTDPPFFNSIPALTPLFHRTSYDWKYKTVPQQSACYAMDNYQCGIASGKGLGGSNIINNMIWHRGSYEDYRGWFNDAKDYNYFEDIEPLFRNVENRLKPVGLNYLTKFSMKISELGSNLNLTVPFVLQRNGRRFTTYDYAKNSASENVKFLTNSFVEKISFAENTQPLRANGVYYNRFGKKYWMKAKKGVILSAGTIGTPKLLMISGIGPCKELEELGIKCVMDLPGVGKNLQDHLATGISLIKLNQSLDLDPISLMKFKNIFNYFNPWVKEKGAFTTVGCELLGFSNINGVGFMVLPVGVTADYGVKLRHVMNLNNTVWQHYFENLIRSQTISVVPVLLNPSSRGEVKLKDSNPESEPLIDPKYLSNQNDIKKLLNGIELLNEFVATQEAKEFGAEILETSFLNCDASTPNYWECYIKHLSFSVYHMVGTCKMGSMESKDTVVERNFKVKNINGLYVVDASVMPNLPSGNPNSVVAMLAEKFLEIILKD